MYTVDSRQLKPNLIVSSEFSKTKILSKLSKRIINNLARSAGRRYLDFFHFSSRLSTVHKCIVIRNNVILICTTYASVVYCARCAHSVISHCNSHNVTYCIYHAESWVSVKYSRVLDSDPAESPSSSTVSFVYSATLQHFI